MKYFSLTALLSALLLTADIVSGVVCTADVQECPDGSFVGRQGPNCDFAACPSSSSSGSSGSKAVACTAEAKLCPDGSYTGRVPPLCEFAPCNGTQGGNGTTKSNNNNVETPTSGPVPSPSPSPSSSSAMAVVGSIVGLALTAVAVLAQL